MITDEWRPIIDRLLTREGSGIEHPEDLGGTTRYGITLKTYRAWTRNPNATEAEVRGLSREICGSLYWRHIVMPQKLNMMFPLLIAEMTLDAGVLFGERRAAIWLQQAVNETNDHESLKVDGVIGTKTLHAVAVCDKVRLAHRMTQHRCEKHVRVVRDRPSQMVFLLGWIRRAFEVAGV